MVKIHTVLVIEDARLIRELVRAILSKAGYSVIEADSGELGLLMVIEHRPDVVLLDVLLAGEMDGLTVCHEIRSISGLENTPVIIMSSLGQEADLAAGRLYGASDYLTKPINSEVLLSRIASALKPGGETEQPETPGNPAEPLVRRTGAVADVAEYRQALKACDRDTLQLIGPSFLKTADRAFGEIVAAYDAEDWTTLERLVVTQRGVVGTFGAPYLEYLFSQIAQEAHCQKVDVSLIRKLEKEFPLFCSALAEQLDQLESGSAT